jgi:hypothetical protein
VPSLRLLKRSSQQGFNDAAQSKPASGRQWVCWVLQGDSLGLLVQGLMSTIGEDANSVSNIWIV